QEELQPFVFQMDVFASAQTLRRLEGVVDRIEVETGAPEAERYSERRAEDVREHPQSHDCQEVRQRLDVLAVVGRAHARHEPEQQRDKWRFLFLASGLMKDAASGARVPPQRLDPGHNAILAAWNPLDAMVAGWAEWTFAGAASRASGIG